MNVPNDQSHNKDDVEEEDRHRRRRRYHHQHSTGSRNSGIGSNDSSNATHHKSWKSNLNDTGANHDDDSDDITQPSRQLYQLQPPNTTTIHPMIGQVSIEVLQCLGVPPTKERSRHQKSPLFAIMVCGTYAFQTEYGMASKQTPSAAISKSTSTTTSSSSTHSHHPNITHWTCEMRRACIIPIHEAYARIYIGIFRPRKRAPSHVGGNNHTTHQSTSTIHTSSLENNHKSPHRNRDIFLGRVVVDLARLRPHSYYNVTLPLRPSAQVYLAPLARQPEPTNGGSGAIRFRVHLQYDSERQALLSYLRPIRDHQHSSPHPTDQRVVTVHCCDVKSFQNVARVVHGTDMPRHFSIRQLQATIREINLTRIHVLRYLRKKECDSLYHWRSPTISAFVFVAYMHSVYHGSPKYILGHVLTYLLLHLFKNYAHYGPMNAQLYNGFIPPTWEELFLTLLLGNKRNVNRSNNYIAPIEMKMKEVGPKDHGQRGNDQHPTLTTPDVDNFSKSDLSTALMSVSSGKSSLSSIAQAFEDGINTQSLRHHFRVYHHVFRGNDAVTFLIQNGYAMTREQAVTIGRRLSEQMQLFEHVSQEHRFEDKPLFYVFTHHDRYEYVVQTHTPWGKHLFRTLGFLSSKSHISKTKLQLEMPYTDGFNHPRTKVKESLWITNKSAKKALVDDDINNNEQAAESDEESISEGFEKGITTFLDQNSSMDDMLEYETDNTNDSNSSVQYLKKPPNQNMNMKNKNEKPIPVLLNETRNKVHGILLHLFDDRTYQLPRKGRPMTRRKASSPSKINLRPGIHAIKSQRHDGISNNANFTPQQQQEQCETNIKNEYDKILGIGKYSHPNVVIARLGLFIQPIVEIAIGWLSLFRALFNIFTWQDPILSFWISFLGPFLIVVLHLFPWRLVLGIVGVVTLGPQNWIRRIRRERKYGPDVFDPDRVVHRRLSPIVDGNPYQGVPLFSSYLADSGRVQHSEESERELFSSDTIRQVVVPYSPLIYSHRFYDWPPESEFTRVSASCTATRTGEASDLPGHHSFSEANSEWDVEYDHDDINDDASKTNKVIHRRRHRHEIRPLHPSPDNDDYDRPSPRWKESLHQWQDKLRHRHHGKGTTVANVVPP